MTDPGAYLHQTATLQATASDGGDGSSITSVKIQRSPAGAGTWTDVCTDSSSPYSCSFDTTAVSDGLYDFRAIAQNDAGGSATSTAVTSRRVDNTAPTSGITDPGTPLRATVSVDATGTDGGSGVANVKVQRSPAGAGTWTDICTDASSPYSCSWDTTGVADGLYDLRAVTTDNAGNTKSSTTVANRRVDNTAPTATMTNPGSPITGTKSFDGTSSGHGRLGSRLAQVPGLPHRRGHVERHVLRHDLAVLVLLRHERARRRSVRLPLARHRQRGQHGQLHRLLGRDRRQHGPDRDDDGSRSVPEGHDHPRRNRRRRGGLRRRQRQDPALACRARHLDGCLHRQLFPVPVHRCQHGDLGRRRPLRPARDRDGQRLQVDDLLDRHQPPRRQHGADGRHDRPGCLPGRDERRSLRYRHGRRVGRRQREDPALARGRRHLDGRLRGHARRPTAARSTRRRSPTASTTSARSRRTTRGTRPRPRRSRTAASTTRRPPRA